MLSKQLSLARSLTLLTILYISAQLSFFAITLTTSGIVHVLIKRSITFEILTANVVIKPLAIFLLTHLILYCLFVFIIWYLSISIGELFRLKYKTTYYVGLFLWLIAAALIIALNSYYFDLSIFSLQNHANISQKNISLIVYCLVTPIIITCLLASINLITRFYYKKITAHHFVAIFILSAFILASLLPKTYTSFKFKPSLPSKPNVIIISVEALRPDFINNDSMPFLNQLLPSTIQFTNAYTPIAQSFPAWISMLTSQLPKHQGARSLYTANADINLHASLITKLKASGYETYYAVDGQRFGDITQETGFDHIISPPSGAAELVIGSVSDFPMINLTTLTPPKKISTSL